METRIIVLFRIADIQTAGQQIKEYAFVSVPQTYGAGPGAQAQGHQRRNEVTGTDGKGMHIAAQGQKAPLFFLGRQRQTMQASGQKAEHGPGEAGGQTIDACLPQRHESFQGCKLLPFTQEAQAVRKGMACRQRTQQPCCRAMFLKQPVQRKSGRETLRTGRKETVSGLFRGHVRQMYQKAPLPEALKQRAQKDACFRAGMPVVASAHSCFHECIFSKQ